MLTTNEQHLVEFLLQCQPGQPRTRGNWEVDHHGTPFLLPSIGGITLNVQVGDAAFGWQGDHIEPGVSCTADTNKPFEHPNVGLQIYSCAGNIATVVTGEAKGAEGRVEKDDVIFATTRPTQLRLSLINEEYSGEVASTGYCVLRAKSDVILPKWIYYHLLSSKFGNYVEENQIGAAYPAISDTKVKEFKMPIPYPNDPEKSLAEQDSIVAILDKFDALTNSISEGLPREMELRQKQYEHYRDLLLSFSKPEEVGS